MSSIDTPTENKPYPPLTQREWAAVDHALEDMNMKDSKPDMESLNVPPVAFGAGGPM